MIYCQQLKIERTHATQAGVNLLKNVDPAVPANRRGAEYGADSALLAD
jgi:hypothetical protein